MASLESINRLLTVAGKLLDSAAAEIRDAKLQPARENIERIGRALTEIFEIQHQIYAVRGDLAPPYLKETSQTSDANRLLTEFMFRASEFEYAGNIEAAIREFELFLTIESFPLHRDIALGEIERLKDAPSP